MVFIESCCRPLEGLLSTVIPGWLVLPLLLLQLHIPVGFHAFHVVPGQQCAVRGLIADQLALVLATSAPVLFPIDVVGSGTGRGEALHVGARQLFAGKNQPMSGQTACIIVRFGAAVFRARPAFGVRYEGVAKCCGPAVVSAAFGTHVQSSTCSIDGFGGRIEKKNVADARFSQVEATRSGFFSSTDWSPSCMACEKGP